MLPSRQAARQEIFKAPLCTPKRHLAWSGLLPLGAPQPCRLACVAPQHLGKLLHLCSLSITPEAAALPDHGLAGSPLSPALYVAVCRSCALLLLLDYGWGDLVSSPHLGSP